jgi:glycerol-3-phosphate dehydrogenase
MTSLSTQILVIGGGATGLGIAWEASLRGLKVVLIEKGDIGQGTTGRYHGVLHSGGRYVISDPKSAKECASENVLLRKIIPHAIEDTGGLFVATPSDPIEYPDEWFSACQNLSLPVEEIPPKHARKIEPEINPRISRAFRVNDATLDSFDLTHSLVNSIISAGGQVWLHHKLVSLNLRKGRVHTAEILDLESGETILVGANVVVNATGPYAEKIAHMAGIQLPIALGKGTMVAMGIRHVNTVINRCKRPGDGDILVPVGTVEILGTTDVPVEEPDDLTIHPWEIDLLIAEGEILVPGLSQVRPLRTWAGIRPLYRSSKYEEATRGITRSHVIINHETRDGIGGFLSVFGGKLTTFRIMAVETVDLISELLDVGTKSVSDCAFMEPAENQHYTLVDRLNALEQPSRRVPGKQILCECELVSYTDVENSLTSGSRLELDDVRRDLRLGMGPCQGGFCGYRAAGMATELFDDAPPDGGLIDFVNERWKGIRPLAWHHNMRQLEFTRRLYLDVLAVDNLEHDIK